MYVYLVSQHSLGVGHLNRTSLLAGEIAKIPEVSVVHVSCGPPVNIFPVHPNVTLVELPPLVVKGLTSTDLVATEPDMTQEVVEKERVRRIAELFRERRPGMLITEFFPFSPHRLGGTLLPILTLIKKKYPDCVTVCSCRDIPVCHREILPPEKVASIASILDGFYDLLLVHSDPALVRLTDIPAFRALKPACPVTYTGYICERRERARRESGGAQPAILVTVGGGRDGFRLVDCALGAASLLGDYRFDIVCGPLMDEEKVALMDRKASGLANTRLLRSVHNLKETIAGYDLVVCSGGYNTLLETIVRRKRCIAVPRRGSYEQGRRIRLFSAKGLLVPVSESRLTPSVLSELIGQALHGAYVPCVTVNTDGLKNTIAAVRRCLSPAECLFGPDGTALPA